MKKHSQQYTSTRRLLILLGISLLLHGVLLFHWQTSNQVLEFDYQLQNLTLNLEPIEVLGQQQAQKKEVNKPNPQPANIPKPVPDKSATTLRSTPQQTASKTNTSSMNRARILSQIRHNLSQYFYYPQHARRKGMQGTVLLSFEISGQGTVHDIRVVKSSGYAILDLAAQDAMQRLDKLSWYAALMHGKDMDLELPVIFRLTEG